MDVIVDGQANFQVDGDPADMLSVIGAITEFLHDSNRAMVRLTVDGEDILPGDMLERISKQPVEGVSKVEVESQPMNELIESALSELVATLPELPLACRQLAEVFHSGKPEEGYESFNELAAIWSEVKQQQLLAASALEIDLAREDVGGKSLQELHEELNATLEECAEAIKNNDCVLIGDLLEYELAPRAEQEADIVAMLRERNAARVS